MQSFPLNVLSTPHRVHGVAVTVTDPGKQLRGLGNPDHGPGVHSSPAVPFSSASR